MAIKVNGNLNTDKDTKTDYSILKGIQEDLFELQSQIDDINGVKFLSVSVTRIGVTPNYEIKVKVNSASVDSVDVLFNDYSAAEPIPENLNISSGVELIDGSKEFIMSTLTFDDPKNAQGEDYIIVFDAKDDQGVSLLSKEWTLTVA